MTRSTPIVRSTTLSLDVDGEPLSFVVGSEQWFAWLADPETIIFSFHDQASSSYTARKERAGSRRGGWYWKAYRTVQGKLYRAYLGKTEELTQARLREVAQVLALRVQAQEGTHAESITFQDPVPIVLEPPVAQVAPLLEAKLQPPRLPLALIERPSLLEQLDAGQRQKLTLLHAPAGSGKSTLVSMWLKRRQQFAEVAWLTLDSGDNDPLRFWTSVIAACRNAHGSPGKEALANLSQFARSPFSALSLEEVLTLLLNDLKRLARPFILALEDYHLIEHERIHATLSFFIEHLPACLHVMILARGEPPLPLVRWRAQGEMLELTSAHLRFSAEEAASFLRLLLPQAFSEDAARTLQRHLEGWPAGMRLLALSLRALPTPQSLMDALRGLDVDVAAEPVHRTIQEYFLHEVFQAQPEPLQTFLLRTSGPRRLTASLCDALTGRDDGGEWLDMIERSGIFLEALDSAGKWYRYHGLWAAVLRGEAARRLDEQELRDIQLAASRWYVSHSMLVEAIETALAAQSFERAADLIVELNARAYFTAYHTQRGWLEQLPSPLLYSRPELCFLLAQTRLFAEDAPRPLWHLDPVEDLLQRAEDGWRGQGESLSSGMLYAFRATFTLVHGQIEQAVDLAHQALQLLPEPDKTHPYADRPPEWIEWHCGCFMALGLAAAQSGAFPESHQYLLQGLTLSLHCPDRVFMRLMDWHLGDVSYEMGRLHQAAAFYQQALQAPAVAEAHGEAIIRNNLLLGLARLHYQWNELDKAEQLLQEISFEPFHGDFAYGEEAQRTRFELARLSLLMARGASAEAREALSDLFVHLQSSPYSLQLRYDVLLWQARRQIADGAPEEAEQTLGSLQAASSDLLPMQQEARQLLQARLHLARGTADEALPLLLRLQTRVQERQQLTRLLEIQLQLALVYFASKQRSDARKLLARILNQARSEDFLRLFLDEGEPLAPLLRSLLPTLTEPAQRSYALSILQALPAASIGADIGPASLLEPLTSQERRVLSLLAAGRSNAEIAETLIVSINTVKGHVKNLYRKLDVTNRTEASEAARLLKLI